MLLASPVIQSGNEIMLSSLSMSVDM